MKEIENLRPRVILESDDIKFKRIPFNTSDGSLKTLSHVQSYW